MRKLILYIFLIVISFYSCENELSDHKFDEGSFVAFESAIVEGKESVSVIKVPVLVVDEGRKEQVTVDFRIIESDTVSENVQYRVLNDTRTLTFASGVGVQYILIEPIDDIDPEEDKPFDIEITSNSKNYRIGFTGKDELNKSCRVVIKEDDCPLTLNWFSGKVVGLEDANWWTDTEGNYEWTPMEEIEPNKIRYHVKGWFYAQLLTSNHNWYTSESQLTFHPTTIILDVSDPASPRYTMLEELAVTDSENLSLSIKPVNNQPLVIDVCGKYVEIPYTVLGTSWAHGYTFTVKFQFE